MKKKISTKKKTSGRIKRKKPNRIFRRFLSFFLFSSAIFIISVSGLILMIRNGYFGDLPTEGSLKEIDNYSSSEIYASGGELLGKYFIHDRTNVNYEDINPFVVDALISTEDARFYEHNGTDYKSLARVLVKNILMGDRSAGGGSTITRQLAKNLFPRQRSGISGLIIEKIKEGIIARRLEKAYDKDQILNLYLNTVPFGENVFGISAASLRYFNKNQKRLNIQESATLIGMLKATTTYNPRLNPEKSLSRRNTVLNQMEKYGILNKHLADSLALLPLEVDYNPINHSQGPAPYFREMLRQHMNEWLTDFNAENKTSYNLYTDGLKIFTTIDYDLQSLAEQAIFEEVSSKQKVVNRHYENIKESKLKELLEREIKRSARYKSHINSGSRQLEINEDFNKQVPMDFFDWQDNNIIELTPLDSIIRSQTILHSGLFSIEPSDGKVRAWVGGNDFRYFQFDHVTSKRQAGSAFKPVIYAAALESGADPCEYISNERFSIPEFEDWSPENHDGNYEGYYSMKGAMTYSVNTVSSRYLTMSGIDNVISLAQKAGITSTLPRVPSLALGSGEVSMIELASFYCIFANSGKAIEPVFIERIENASGEVLYIAPQNDNRQVISRQTSLLMNEILRGVTEVGTASSLRNLYGLNFEMAGKTGTTTNNADGWFVGYTPGLVTAVWTGLENPAFAREYPLPFGASGCAVPVWGNFMAKAFRNNNTSRLVGGSFPEVPAELKEKLSCELFVEAVDKPSFLERLFGKTTPEEPAGEEIHKNQKKEDNKKGRLRKWLRELF